MKNLYNLLIILLIILSCSRNVPDQKILVESEVQSTQIIQIDNQKDTIKKDTIKNIEIEITESKNPIEDPKIIKRNLVQNTYMSQIGIREKTGNNDGKEIEMYLKSAGLTKGNPWCASFVTYVYKQNDINVPKTGLGWVPSYFPSSKTIYVRGKYSKIDPKYGDLIGIWFENKGRLAHIGFYDHEDDTYFYTVEGNTNEAGSREGDGVYNKKRIKRQVHSISNWID